MSRKVIVLHAYYGCETGCCGHVIEVDGEREGKFNFFHPRDTKNYLEWAQDFVRQELGEDHVKDLDWENCRVSDD